ncbi:murein biosynthesis integral membrane protein MurJ [Candidatus Riesia pediculicola]|uniref:Integral membrane protein MviN n=1 Tax=Riesia pediculicola (strain USDA) TaxID=515618 RepID=D4G8P1_RIEPU|nr:murein biosynthesis integral membrane protein MurJ [Candidatus Riesia pediculicola]ADD79515.1 integral membrane protein MviN [Candidatus Riesia pediculicola USDA]ARC53918.1 hypothetical protein AOE55_02040 [Candidatus Riesia pediculicola]QOJ86547.1 murein biosynthesis integral membrane protein MurJ [Candidatus Riesia pediculicola]
MNFKLNLAKSFLNHTVFSIVSKILGFFREISIVFFFGIGYQTDAFILVSKLSNIFRYILTEGTIIQMFLPLLIEYKKKNNQEKIRKFLSKTSGNFITILSFLIIVGIIFSKWIIFIFAPGLINQEKTLNLAIILLRESFPSLIINTLITFSNIVLYAWNFFYKSSLSQIIFNACFIGLLFISSFFKNSINILSFIIIASGGVQLCYQILCLKKIDIIFFPKINFKISDFYDSLKILYSSISISLLNQCIVIFNNVFLSFLPIGSFSWLYYAEKISSVPVGIFISSLNTILFPNLLKNAFKKTNEKFHKILHYGIEMSSSISMLFFIIIFQLSYPIVITLFQYKNFDVFHINMIQYSVKVNSFGIISHSLLKIMISVLYAIKDTRTHFKISFINLILSQTTNFLLFNSFKHIGISLSTVLTSWFDIFFLSYILHKKEIRILPDLWKRLTLQIFISSISTTLFLSFLMKIIPDWRELSILFRFLHLVILLFVSILNYSSIFLIFRKIN